MGVDIYRLSYRHVYDHVTEQEFDFIFGCLSMNDAGSYSISKESLATAVKLAREKNIKVPRELVSSLRKELAIAGEDFDVQIF